MNLHGRCAAFLDELRADHLAAKAAGVQPDPITKLRAFVLAERHREPDLGDKKPMVLFFNDASERDLIAGMIEDAKVVRVP